MVPAIALWALAIGAQAQEESGALRAGDLVGDARWYLHVDFVELKAGRVGPSLLEQLDAPAKARIDAFGAMVAFNPFEDLDALTLSGRQVEPERAVAVVRGDFDREHLLKIVPAATGYRSEVVAGETVHSWLDEKSPGGRLYAALPEAGGRLLMGPDFGLLSDLLEGGRENAAGGRAVVVEPLGGRPPIVCAYADFSLLAEVEIRSEFVRGVRSVELAAGESEGRLLGRAKAVTGDGRTARLLARVAGGAVALAEAAERLPAGTSDGLVAEADGDRLLVQGEIPLASVDRLLKDLESLAKNR